MNGLIGIFSLSALLLTVSGQLSNLSPSYSFLGDIVQTRDGQVTTGTIIQAVDTTRRLGYLEVTYIGESSLTSISLYSENDNTVHSVVNGVCNETTFPSNSNQFNISTWDLYTAGTESPAGTFTSSQGNTTYELTIVNGVPAVFTTTYSTSIIVITVTNFEMPPAFSIFSLPTECSQFTCTACYSSAVSVSISVSISVFISVLLLLITLLLYLCCIRVMPNN